MQTDSRRYNFKRVRAEVSCNFDSPLSRDPNSSALQMSSTSKYAGLPDIVSQLTCHCPAPNSRCDALRTLHPTCMKLQMYHQIQPIPYVWLEPLYACALAHLSGLAQIDSDSDSDSPQVGRSSSPATQRRLLATSIGAPLNDNIVDERLDTAQARKRFSQSGFPARIESELIKATPVQPGS